MADMSGDGWVTLGNRSTWRGLGESSTRLTVLGLVGIPFAVSALVRVFIPDRSVALVGSVGLVVLGSAIIFVIARVVLRRTVRISIKRAELAVGKQIIPFSSVNRAAVGYELQRRTLGVYLVFGEDKHPMASVCLRSTVEPELDEAQRSVVVELLRQSRVELPTTKPDPYDPKGKFAWMDHPTSLTRDEAIEFVLHTPESGEPLRQEPRLAVGFDDET